MSFEITCHGYTRNFLSLEERERERERAGVMRNNKLSEEHSIQLHKSNFRVRGQTAQNVVVHIYFLVAHTHDGTTQ